MSAVEKFPVLLSEAEEESSAVPPCFSDEGINVRQKTSSYLSRFPGALFCQPASSSCLDHSHVLQLLPKGIAQLTVPLLSSPQNSISTSDTTTSTSSLSQNATPTPPRSSFSYTRSSRFLQNTSKNSRKNRYGIILSSSMSC